LNQRRKNIRQFTYLAILISITVVVVVVKVNRDGFDYDKQKFTLDENTIITTVILKGKDFSNRFEYLNGAWQVNNKYLLDTDMRDVFFAVLSRVEVKRPVSVTERDSIASTLEENGVWVGILNNADTIDAYFAGGDEGLFQSYFMSSDDKQPYLVHIPGYHSYLAGIFSASENDWRSRFIWEIDWTTLKKLTIDIKEETQPLVFEYKNNFIGVDGIDKLDTASMMEYLESIANLQTDKYLHPGEIPVYNQIIETSDPEVVISVEQIGDRKSSLFLYPRPEGKQYYPGVLNNDQLLLFQPQILQNILARSADFELEE